MASRAEMVLVGSESLMGREIRDLVATSAPEIHLRLMAADEEEPGTLTRLGDEPALVEELQAENLAGARAVFLAGSADSSRKALDDVDAGADGSTVFIDLTYTAEERIDARLRAPLVECEADEDGAAALVSAHRMAHLAEDSLQGVAFRQRRAQRVMRVDAGDRQCRRIESAAGEGLHVKMVRRAAPQHPLGVHVDEHDCDFEQRIGGSVEAAALHVDRYRQVTAETPHHESRRRGRHGGHSG